MSALWDRLLQSLSPQQVCWLCLLLTLGAGGYGMTVFAKDSEVKAIRVELLQKDLLDLRIRQCQAIKTGQQAAFFAGKVQEQSDKYQAITGRRPQLPGCSEL